MTANELANCSLMNEDDAEKILRVIDGIPLFSPEMIIRLSLDGFSAAEIHHKLQYDLLYLVDYLASRRNDHANNP